jgi:hypothetical protein
VNFSHRIRQHNGEITGGAKKTKKWRPWIPVCVIKGFYESSQALRFEYRLQHPGKRRKAGEDSIMFTIKNLIKLINNGDGSVAKDNKMPWPPLIIEWYSSQYNIPTVTNLYIK